MRYIFLLLLNLVLCAGCLKKFVYTANNNQIAALFSNLTYKDVQKTITYKNGKISIHTIGDATKPMLIIVHGAPGEWYNSFPNFLNQTLLDNFFIVTYDRPGYGKSSRTPFIASINYQTEVLEKVIDATKNNNYNINILARSYGTPIAANYAAAHSQNIAKLILTGSTTAPQFERIFWFSYLGKFSITQWLMPKAITSSTDEKFAHKKELQSIAPNYKNINCRTFIIHGTKDWIADSLNLYYNKVAFTKANTTAIMIDGAPHNIISSNPSFIRSILLDSI